MHVIGKAGDPDAASARSRVKQAVRRGVAQVGSFDRAARRLAERRRSGSGTATVDAVSADGDAVGRSVDTTRNADAATNEMFAEFFRMLCVDGDIDRAAVSMTRKLIAARDPGRARSIFQALQQYEQFRPIADICVALCAVGEPMPDTAWSLFTRNDLGLVMRYAPVEYFRIGFVEDPETASASLARVLAGDVALTTSADSWLAIAHQSFASRGEDLSRRALQRAEAELANSEDDGRIDVLSTRIATLRSWHGRAARAAEPVELPDGEIPFALIDHKHPDAPSVSRWLTDTTETLTTLGHVLRHDGLKLTGEAELLGVAERLRNGVAPARRIDGPSSTVRLFTVDRDLSMYAAVPDGTWTIVSDWFANPQVGPRFDVPLNPRLRPIFVSFSTDVPPLRTAGAADYLRKYAPIGCLDWDTVFMLHAAGIPAFFSGGLAATIDTMIARMSKPNGKGKLVFDLEPEGRAEKRTLWHPETRQRTLAENLAFADEVVRRHQDGNSSVVTSDLRWALSARAVGFDVELRPDHPDVSKYVDHKSLSDDEFASLQQGINDKLAAVLGAVLAGRSEDEVYAVWREACAADVAHAQAVLNSVEGHPSLSFDLDEVCDTIRAASVVVERTEAAPDGPEVNIEFSLDANYKHQLDIVLDSVVAHTSRPLRAFVLCRDHGPDDFERMARLFPTVSFVWLPTDNVDYGRITGMNRWVTPATMDRTALPLLLPDVDRIIHFDLDAVCLSDLAELFELDMQGKPVAAAAEPQPSYVSGFETFRRSARRLRREGDPDLARELLIRTHTRHGFDFDIFNAGLMVLDLAKMRADDFCGRYLPYVQVFGLNGQVVLNAYAGSDCASLGGEWNRLLRLEMPGEPKVAHWAGPYKPWKYHHYVTGRELWREGEERFAAREERARLAVPVGPTGP
ncbi:MAG: glycosyltransferase family 8 protein [Jatrophihabitantaceae bacterium]